MYGCVELTVGTLNVKSLCNLLQGRIFKFYLGFDPSCKIDNRIDNVNIMNHALNSPVGPNPTKVNLVNMLFKRFTFNFNIWIISRWALQ